MRERFDSASWPKKDAVKIVKGNGEAEIAVFEDPNCGYCKELDVETLSRLDNVTIYVFLWPFLGDSSVEIADSVLCSANPGKAFMDWMVEGELPTANPKQRTLEVLNRNIELADKLGLNGTPSIFLSNGEGPIGMIDAESLALKIERA